MKRCHLGPVERRVANDLQIQRAIEHIVRLGARSAGHAFGQLLDRTGAPPSVLDGLLDWQRLDPQVVSNVGGRNFPKPPLNLLPKQKRVRAAKRARNWLETR